MIIIEQEIDPGETVILDGQISLYPGAQVAVKS